MDFSAHPSAGRAPQDFCDLLEKNFREQRPLLDGALVYRGTSTPVQEGGVISKDVMHAALLPCVATQYTCNYAAGQAGFIGAYPLSRDAVFYKDWHLEKALDGKDVPGLTVPQLEDRLHPQVEQLAAARDDTQRAQIRRDIESFVRVEAHETGLRLRQPDGSRVEGHLHYYTGAPHAHSNREALQGMAPVTNQNSERAREAVFDLYRGQATEALRALRVNPQLARQGAGPSVPAPAVQGALDRLTAISRREFSQELRRAYGNLPLSDLAKAVVEHPVSRQQAQLRDLGIMLHEAVHSPNPQTQRTGVIASKLIANLPESASYKELCGAMGVAARYAQAEQGAAPQQPGRGPSAASPRTADGMAR